MQLDLSTLKESESSTLEFTEADVADKLVGCHRLTAAVETLRLLANHMVHHLELRLVRASAGMRNLSLDLQLDHILIGILHRTGHEATVVAIPELARSRSCRQLLDQAQVLDGDDLRLRALEQEPLPGLQAQTSVEGAAKSSMCFSRALALSASADRELT